MKQEARKHNISIYTCLSPAESVFGAPIVLPNEFLQGDEVAVDSIIKNFQH
jgi:hypothetical protein